MKLMVTIEGLWMMACGYSVVFDSLCEVACD